MAETPEEVKLTWARGGGAVILALSEDVITVRSSVAYPPGARVEGALESGRAMKMKVHGSKRQDDGSFVISGRPIDLLREVREEVQARLIR